MPDSKAPNGAPSPNDHDRAAGPDTINRAIHRAAVNRVNAQKSTGPRTEAGKQRSKLNALRHGLTGQTVVLPTEDHSAYERHSQSFLDQYHPKDATETQLVQSLIDTSWRMNRAAAVETNLFSLGITEMDAQIREIQAERRAAEQRQLDKAAKILKMHKDENIPYEPVEDGFVFSNDQI